MKRVLGGIVILVALLGVGAYFLMSNLGPLVKAAVENYGGRIVGAPVTVDRVEISAKTGEGRLTGLVVGNPAGFSSAPAFQLSEIAIELDLDSVAGGPIVIKSISIAGPRIAYEIGRDGSNIDALVANVQAYGASSPGAQEAAPDDGRKLIVDDLKITGGKIAVSAKFLPGAGLSAKLPDIHMTGIGRKSGGARPGELVGAVMGRLSGETGGAVAALNNEQISKALSKGREALEKGKKGAERVRKGLKKLFGD